MYPINPRRQDITVIGVHTTSSSSTVGKKYFRDIYDFLGIPLVCHSCGNVLQQKQSRYGTFETYIGDHQPPSKLKSLIDHPEMLIMGKKGKLSDIVGIIREEPKLVLYNFEYDIPMRSQQKTDGTVPIITLKLQTNCQETLLW